MIRPATLADMSAITRLVTTGMEADPVFPYRYPARREFPDDYFAFTRARLVEIFSAPDIQFLVYTVPSTAITSSDFVVGQDRNEEIAGVAVWELPSEPGLPSAASKNVSERALAAFQGGVSDKTAPDADAIDVSQRPARHAAPARVSTFSSGIEAGKAAQFGTLDREQDTCHVYLALLCVHPAHHRRGIGRQLVEWGIERTRNAGLGFVALFGSPMGRLLYASLGFERVGQIRIQVDGEEEFVDEPAMVLWL